MKIEYQDIITLSDDNKYVVASKVDYKNTCYLYLVDINNHSNIKIVKIDADDSLLELNQMEDHELITKLIPLFYNFSKDVLKS